MRIPEIKLVPQPDTDEGRAAVGFRWNSTAGTRHKLGGEPDWLQPPERPKCPACPEEMTFYAQLDSIGDDYCLADCGMVFVFVCFDCFTTASVLHST